MKEDYAGQSCFESGLGSATTKKRRKPTHEELAGAKRVRAQGACLRCYVQKLKVSKYNLPR